MSWPESYALVIFFGVLLSTLLVFIFRTKWVYVLVLICNIALVIGLEVLVPTFNSIPSPGVLFGVTIGIGLVVVRSVRGAGWGKN